MSSTLWYRPATSSRYHRLLTVGEIWFVTGCRVRTSATDHIHLTPREPPEWLRCHTCYRDYQIKRSRVPTVDLRPSVREVGVYAELTIEAAPVRGEMQRPAGRLGESAEDEWSERSGGVPEVAIEDMVSRRVAR